MHCLFCSLQILQVFLGEFSCPKTIHKRFHQAPLPIAVLFSRMALRQGKAKELPNTTSKEVWNFLNLFPPVCKLRGIFCQTLPTYVIYGYSHPTQARTRTFSHHFSPSPTTVLSFRRQRRECHQKYTKIIEST